MLAVFREICAVGSTTVFDVKGLTVDGIREELDYGGLCIKTNATIGGARVRSISALAIRSSRTSPRWTYQYGAATLPPS